MSESGKDKLLALLSGSDKELVNLKFFPGDNVSSGDELCDAAHNALALAFSGKGIEQIPPTGRNATPFAEVVSAR